MKRRGFTLVELIAVVAIIAILAAVILPNVFGQIRKGRVSRNLAEAGDIKTGVLQFFADVGIAPVEVGNTDGALDRLLSNAPPLVIAGVPNWRGPYLDKTPRTADRPPLRYSSQYGGCLMYNDDDDGAGDEALGDDNGDGVTPDRFVYIGNVPSRDAVDTDRAVDGEVSDTAGHIVNRAGDCGGLDTNDATCWPAATPDTQCSMEIIVESG